MFVVVHCLFFGEVYGVVDFAACWIDACYEHHFVGFGGVHDGFVDIFHIFLGADAHVVDVEDDESFAYACFLEFAVGKGLDLHPSRKAEFAELLCGKFLEGTT